MDPYKVLGVTPDATDEQVKAAYHDLARKYHPDNYVNNPLADLAQEKMKQINEAYDTIQRQRKQNGSRASYQNQGYSGQTSYRAQGESSQFNDIRRLIMQRRMVEAEELLDGVPGSQRNGEWYFLKGNVQYSKGWLDEAYRCFTKANQLSPGNAEYQSALNQMAWQRSTGRPAGMGYGGYNTTSVVGCTPCDMCAGLMCADFCCDCMCDDFCC